MLVWNGVADGKTVTPELRAFLAELDMFYLGTANAEGQPYIQYRGGSRGFFVLSIPRHWALLTSQEIGNTSPLETSRKTPKRSSF